MKPFIILAIMAISAYAWTPHVISQGSGLKWNDAIPADLDQDGSMDVVAASYSNTLGWFEGPGWTYHSIDTSRQAPTSLVAQDLNADNHIDIVCAWTSSNQIVIYWGPTWTSTTVMSCTSPREIDCADVSEDGKPDIVAGCQNGSVWFFCADGWVGSEVEDDLGQIDCIDVVELVSWTQPKPEILVGTNPWTTGTILFLAQAPSGGWGPHVICNTFSGVRDLHGCRVNPNTAYDVLASGWGYGASYWINNSDGTFQPEQHFATASGGSALSVFVESPYGYDIAFGTDETALDAEELRIYSAPSYTTYETVLSGADITQIVVCDMDGDYGQDLLVSSHHGMGIWWVENELTSIEDDPVAVSPLSLSVSPNPTTSVATIQVSGVDSGEMTIYDVSGRSVANGWISGSTQWEAPVAGMYLIEVRSGSEAVSTRLVVLP